MSTMEPDEGVQPGEEQPESTEDEDAAAAAGDRPAGRKPRDTDRPAWQ
jgi:hypothetical protein